MYAKISSLEFNNEWSLIVLTGLVKFSTCPITKIVENLGFVECSLSNATVFLTLLGNDHNWMGNTVYVIQMRDGNKGISSFINDKVQHEKRHL